MITLKNNYILKSRMSESNLLKDIMRFYLQVMELSSKYKTEIIKIVLSNQSDVDKLIHIRDTVLSDNLYLTLSSDRIFSEISEMEVTIPETKYRSNLILIVEKSLLLYKKLIDYINHVSRLTLYDLTNEKKIEKIRDISIIGL